MNRFDQKLAAPLRSAPRIQTLQVNLGRVCNLACKHCHVESSPARDGDQENMSAPTAEKILAWLARYPQVRTVDLTGGSPEMNPNFRRIVAECHRLGRRVIDRCNPTILLHDEPSFAWVPSFLAEHRVEVVASLPCYLEENVNAQRGRGAYNASIEGLLRLNAVGYGVDPALRLNLVYNPTGPRLPPAQDALAEDYHRELRQRFGLVFNELWTITNMPITRWRAALERGGTLDGYLDLLDTTYNPASVERLMCRSQVHVDSQGALHDCDFNFATGLPMPGFETQRLWDIELSEAQGRPIATADHCLGCTAGAGSSCGGAIVP
ncbi:molybdenum cofactor biosynthesis protein A [Pirellulimonas nuda]|uniref:Molybdenum cofactor biosynthesis protein A n=1 Tax=Pirellulimonas nuda TaxID=2528009 RepID=A0A518DB01_9BACT|nr:arsenosugar biosynthesis radical SAM (seleno)protein ArsS [Pirellulimonas nuda]QDU88596.1 molybdenum cofactor biosynthesis protein A [Pirellulimonas nuda]